jgi:hypothetical protein
MSRQYNVGGLMCTLKKFLVDIRTLLNIKNMAKNFGELQLEGLCFSTQG